MTLEGKLDTLIGLFREHAAYQRQILNRLLEEVQGVQASSRGMQASSNTSSTVHQQRLSALTDLTAVPAQSYVEFAQSSLSSVISFDPPKDLERAYEKDIYGYLVIYENQMKGKTFDEILKNKSLCKDLDHTFHTCVVNFFDFPSLFQNQMDSRTKQIIDSEALKRTKIVQAYLKILNLFGVSGVDISKLHSRLRAKMRQSIRKARKDPLA
jgi:hypothetical protein